MRITPYYFLKALTAVELVTLKIKVPEVSAVMSGSPTIVTPEPAVRVNLCVLAALLTTVSSKVCPTLF